MTLHDDIQGQREHFARDAAMTFVAVALAFGALDDITTDTDTSFAFERVALAGCAVWFVFLARQFWRQRHRVLGVLSFGLVTIAAIAQPAIRQGGDPFWFQYLSTIAALAWFLLMAGVLAGRGFARRRSSPTRSHLGM